MRDRSVHVCANDAAEDAEPWPILRPVRPDFGRLLLTDAPAVIDRERPLAARQTVRGVETEQLVRAWRRRLQCDRHAVPADRARRRDVEIDAVQPDQRGVVVEVAVDFNVPGKVRRTE